MQYFILSFCILVFVFILCYFVIDTGRDISFKFLPEQIYYINLNHRTDRQRHMKQLCKGSEILRHAIRFPSVYGKNGFESRIFHSYLTPGAIDDIFKNSKASNWFTILSYGSFGCALSHIAIWERISKLSDDVCCLILEDDIEITNNFDQQFNLAMKEVPNQWDILYLGWHHGGDFYTKPYNNKWNKMEQCYGLFSYMINSRSAKKLLSICLPLRYQIDTEIQKAHKSMRVYSTKNPIIQSAPSENSIWGTDTQLV